MKFNRKKLVENWIYFLFFFNLLVGWLSTGRYFSSSNRSKRDIREEEDQTGSGWTVRTGVNELIMRTLDCLPSVGYYALSHLLFWGKVWWSHTSKWVVGEHSTGSRMDSSSSGGGERLIEAFNNCRDKQTLERERERENILDNTNSLSQVRQARKSVGVNR